MRQAHPPAPLKTKTHMQRPAHPGKRVCANPVDGLSEHIEPGTEDGLRTEREGLKIAVSGDNYPFKES